MLCSSDLWFEYLALDNDLLLISVTVAYGIPSIKRDGHSYLTGTLQSLIQGLTEEDKDEVVLIVFIGDVSLFIHLRVFVLYIQLANY